MNKLKERFEKWKNTRSLLQKSGDVFFWVLLVLLVIPGPRKFISTNLNRVIMQVKNPGIISEEKQIELTDQDYRWILTGNDGIAFQFSDLKDRVIFLNFWATWCPPCVAELPEIQKAYEKHGDDVAFILVSNQEAGIVEAFMEKHGYDLPVYYPGSATPGCFESASIPTTFIISGEGRIVSKKKGAINWDSRATDRIFGELIR